MCSVKYIVLKQLNFSLIHFTAQIWKGDRNILEPEDMGDTMYKTILFMHCIYCKTLGVIHMYGYCYLVCGWSQNEYTISVYLKCTLLEMWHCVSVSVAWFWSLFVAKKKTC